MTDPTNKPPLDYERRRKRWPAGLQASVAALVTAAALAGVAFLLGLLAFSLSYEEEGGGFGWVYPVGVVLVLGVAAYFAQRAARNPARRAVAAGIWIGMGQALLIVGVCFAL
jgi:hypothetical protein